MKTFLITGASGLIGSRFIKDISKRAYRYFAVSSNPERAIKILNDPVMVLGFDEIEKIKTEKIDVIINLAGSNIGSGRWTEKRRNQIYFSRVNATKKIVDLALNLETKPDLIISSSGIDYYGDTGSKFVDENFPSGNSFLSKVCRDWEKEAMKAEDRMIRVVTMRTGVVIAKNAPAVKKILTPYRFFVGGPLGSGEQYFSWIHIDDLISLMLFVSEHKEITGPVNAVSPNPLKMNELSETIGKVMGKPSVLRVPEFMLKIIMGEASELVLSSHRVVPAKAEQYGFKFQFTDFSEAVKNIL